MDSANLNLTYHNKLNPLTEQTPPTSSEEISHFQLYAHFQSIDPTHNRYRFYTITFQDSLFGDVLLIRSWGRLGTRGHHLVTPYPDRASAQPQVDRFFKRRIKRGYQLLDSL